MSRIIFIFLIFSCTYSFAQNDSAWIYVYGGSSHDYAKQIIATRDSGYLIIGTTSSFGVANSDIYVIKTDKNCNRQWSKIYGTPAIEWGYGARETYDGGFILCGFTNQNLSSGYDVYLLKIDAMGNLLWSKTPGGTDWDFGYGIELTADSGFIVIGRTYSTSNGGADLMILKTDSLGNVSWLKNFGGAGDETANTIYKTKQGDFLVLGETNSFGAGDKDFYIIRIDDTGDTLWTKAYGTTAFDSGNAIDSSGNGNYWLFGTSEGSPYGGGKEFYLMELTPGGDTMYTYFNGGPGSEIGRYFLQFPNGDFLFGGSTNSDGIGGTALYMIGFHDLGNFIGGAYFGGDGDEEGYSVALGLDGQIVFAGTTTTDSFGIEDVYLVRIDTLLPHPQQYPQSLHYYNDSLVSVDEIVSYNENNFSIYPNPFHGSTTVSQGNIPLKGNENITVVISDITGRTVKKIPKVHFPLQLESNGKLKAGAYFISFYFDDVLHSSEKLIIY